MLLGNGFFARPCLEVCRDLLGKNLCRETQNGSILRLRINEVEAYDGWEDKASHASRGRTPRNSVMFGPAGVYYLYLIYGMYWMLNIVTADEGHPSAILIRGAGEYDGPGKLTRSLEITKTLNRQPVCQSTGLWFEESAWVPPQDHIKRTPRIGVAYAGPEWSQKQYRFLLSPPRKK